MQSNKTKWEKTYENSMETGREICGEKTGHFRIKRETWQRSDKRKVRSLQEMATKQKRN